MKALARVFPAGAPAVSVSPVAPLIHAASRRVVTLWLFLRNNALPVV